ncbi:hypothetical protein [Nonomuraea diastatica]|uniref:Uncharacterized protein n=1 Tax=Nonomuraea diastatica TaxID=1848329 RepID=A0A4R4W5W2_9ACTN|nr:hypothetical protein [Nonomuraea diastatica]TDD10455.1 hypothetical protein E1294_46120 [Nonomuraea diastatica]
MDSHGSEPPRRAAAPVSSTGATTSRPAGPDTVTGCRPAVEIPEFRDIEQLPDGSWTAVHKPSGEVITAPDFEQLERVEAPMVRLAYARQRAS